MASMDTIHTKRLISEASQYKQEGNQLFKAKKLSQAQQKYFKSLETLNNVDSNISCEALSELIISVNNNIALIYFKLKDYEQCIHFSDNVLHNHPNNTKALLRKGQGLLYIYMDCTCDKNNIINNTQQLLSAKSCFEKAKLSLNSDDANVKYLSIINRSMKITNIQMNKLNRMNKLIEKQKLYSSFFGPKPSKKINLSHLSLFGSDINCVCSMYVTDYINKKNTDFESIKFRLSPFDIKYKHKTQKPSNIQLQPTDLVQYDSVTDFDGNKAQIAYLHLGSDTANIKELYMITSNFKWPSKYTFILWIKWERNMKLITTFDSGSNAPIYIDKKHIGCASEGAEVKWNHDWCTVTDYEINPDDDEWCFVAAQGGNDNSDMYIGDLHGVPEYIGNVKCDIGNKITWRIGNISQGPGKVASILIFDGYLNTNELKNVYYQSRNEIFVPLTSKQHKASRQLVLNAVKLPELVNIIFDYVRYNDF